MYGKLNQNQNHKLWCCTKSPEKGNCNNNKITKVENQNEISS